MSNISNTTLKTKDEKFIGNEQEKLSHLVKVSLNRGPT